MFTVGGSGLYRCTMLLHFLLERSCGIMASGSVHTGEPDTKLSKAGWLPIGGRGVGLATGSCPCLVASSWASL